MKSHHWIAIAGVFGAMGIAVGAFGAHGLPGFLANAGFDDAAIATRLETFETGARYHLYAALALLGIGLASDRWPHRTWSAAGGAMLLGGVLFSHLLYALAVVPGYRWLGAIVPLGGAAMIAGWLLIAFAAVAGHKQSKRDS